MLVPNINQQLTALTAFLNKYEPGLFVPTDTPRCQLCFKNSLLRETVSAIYLNYGDELLQNKWETSCIISAPKVVNQAIELEIFTWDNRNNCGRIQTLVVAPDTQYTCIKAGNVHTEFKILVRAIKLFANPQDDTLTPDDLKKVIWCVKNSKHPILRLLNMPIDDFGMMMANFLFDSIEKRFNFE